MITTQFTIDAGQTKHISFSISPQYLALSEYPYDAERGFTVPGGQFTYLFNNGTFQLYGDDTVVSVPLPDGSMPSNVVCISLTVLIVLAIRLIKALRQDPKIG